MVVVCQSAGGRRGGVIGKVSSWVPPYSVAVCFSSSCVNCHWSPLTWLF